MGLGSKDRFVSFEGWNSVCRWWVEAGLRQISHQPCLNPAREVVTKTFCNLQVRSSSLKFASQLGLEKGGNDKDYEKQRINGIFVVIQ